MEYLEKSAIMDALMDEQYGYLCEDAINAIPTVDIVRCKDCKHATMSANGWCILCAKVNPKGTLNFPSGFFCALGERK